MPFFQPVHVATLQFSQPQLFKLQLLKPQAFHFQLRSFKLRLIELRLFIGTLIEQLFKLQLIVIASKRLLKQLSAVVLVLLMQPATVLSELLLTVAFRQPLELQPTAIFELPPTAFCVLQKQPAFVDFSKLLLVGHE